MSENTGKAIASVAIAGAIAFACSITQSAEPLWAGFVVMWMWS